MAVKTNYSNVKIEGLDQMIKNSDRILKQVHGVPGKATLEAAKMMQADAVKRAKEKTGRLKARHHRQGSHGTRRSLRPFPPS